MNGFYIFGTCFIIMAILNFFLVIICPFFLISICFVILGVACSFAGIVFSMIGRFEIKGEK